MTTYTIKNNSYYNSLELSFSEKPSQEIREALKQFRFRWNHTLKIWYGFANKDHLTSCLDSLLQIEKPVIQETKKILSEKLEKLDQPSAKKKAAKTELKPEKKPATEKPAASYYKMPGINKLKKAVMSEKQPCIMVVDKKDNSIIAKLPAGSSTEKYDRFKYCFYTIY